MVRRAGLVLGLLAFAGLLLIPGPLHDVGVHGDRPARAAAVTALMAIWWLTEALPIHWTATVPLLLYPALGVFGRGFAGDVGATLWPYVDPYIFLFLGGMCIGAAMQQWGLHRRIALAIMRLIGTDPRRLLLGVLCGAAVLSMWISNTATAAMMVPIGMAVIAQLERRTGGHRLVAYGASLMLAVAYAANVGGMATKIGTAPNALFAGFMAAQGTEVTFLAFMAVGLPFVLLLVPVLWAVLWLSGRADAPREDVGAAVLAAETASLGPMQRGERVVLAVFGATAALWIAGKPLTGFLVARWPHAGITSAHVEGGTAMLAALVLTLWRVRGVPALRPRSLRLVPWSTLLLLGGAFSMAQGVQGSGLSAWMGEQLAGLRGVAPFQQVLLASLTTVGLSGVASNTATIGVMLNVLRDAVPGENLTTVLFAATLASSCDFALPAGTPPNAIVFGSGYVTVARMVRTGLILDVVAGVMVAGWCWLVVGWVLG